MSLGQPSALEKGLRSYEMCPKANRVFNLSMFSPSADFTNRIMERRLAQLVERRVKFP